MPSYMASPVDAAPDDDQHESASRTQLEPGRQHESVPLVSATEIRHCHIGVVVIQHQQCPLLHNHFFHPPNEDPLPHGKRSRVICTSDANVESPAKRMCPLGGAAELAAVELAAASEALPSAVGLAAASEAPSGS